MLLIWLETTSCKLWHWTIKCIPGEFFFLLLLLLEINSLFLFCFCCFLFVWFFALLPGFYNGTGSAIYMNRLSQSSKSLENCKFFLSDYAMKTAYWKHFTIFDNAPKRSWSYLNAGHCEVLTLEDDSSKEKLFEKNAVIVSLREHFV